MKVFVGGINGAGKTTICDLAAQKLGIKHIKGSALLMDYLGSTGDYEKLRALSRAQQEHSWNTCAEALLSDEYKESFLLDAHYLSLNRGKINAKVGDWIKKFDALILISAPIENIVKRIEMDTTKRDRALFSEKSEENEVKNLHEHQKVTRDEFLRILEISKKPGIEIINYENKLDKSVSTLVGFLKGI